MMSRTATAVRSSSLGRAQKTHGAGSPGFRPDIQGLRAGAVLLVVLYHAGLPFLPGGYIGVDVFFVISGFLITGHLAQSLERDGRVGLLRFYARRALRILPASFAVALLTAGALVFVAPIVDLPRLLRDARATLLYYPNVRFAQQSTDYLADHAASPFQHYWSLGIEEQFYLGWPLLLMGLFLLVRGRRAWVVAGVVLLAVASCVYGAWLTPVDQPAAFFLLPSRAWQLLAGGLVALLARGGGLDRIPPALRAVLGWGGMAVVLGAAVRFDEFTAFPGIAALAPVLGTAAVITAGTGGRVPGLAPVLALRPAQYLGEMSYSLYLVHWPLVIVPQTAVGFQRPLPLWLTVLLGVVVAIPLAHVLNRFVEEPLRAPAALVRRPRSSLIGVVAVTAVIAVAMTAVIGWSDRREVPTAGVVTTLTGMPDAPPVAARQLPSNLRPALDAAAASTPILYSDGCMHRVVQETVQDCVFGPEGGTRRVALFGDSHAAQWFPALLRIAEGRGDARIATYTKTSCPAVEVTVLDQNVPYLPCDRWREAVLQTLEADPPDVVVISSYAHYDLAGVDDADRPDAWAKGMSETVTRLRQAGSQVLVIADTPMFLGAPATCAAQFPSDLLNCAIAPAEAFDGPFAEAEARAAQDAGAFDVDLRPYLCDEKLCPIVTGDLLLYRDTHHLSVEAVEHLAPALEPAVAEALAAAGP